MPSFLAGAFAIAGAVAAAGPLVIHLLNRRRYRTVSFAAMDFLREAARRSRRYLHLRDLLLLLLRTACLLLFGFALARPYLADSDQAGQIGQPVHAVIVVDNSLSMGYQRLDGTVLDEAKTKVREFIERLPPGSRISILPLCGGTFSWDPYRTREDALEALAGIEVVDLEGGAVRALDIAREASQRAPELAAKRIVLVGDQQAIDWPTSGVGAELGPAADLQIVQIAPDKPENAWIAGFELDDGIADVETGCTFRATLKYEGATPRSNVQVTLAIDGVPVASQTVDLEPGQAREVTFPYRFDVATEPGRAVYSTAAVSIPADRLAADDERVLSVPVVAALPVVFVDQFGPQEDPLKNQYGETFRLRRLLAPVASRGDYARQLIQVRHLAVDQLSRDTLQDARLLVIAGIENPQSIVAVVREYVEQGGPVVIAAGGAFDPAAWNQAAWLEGRGILPVPLAGELVGVRPDEAPDRLQPFFLDPATLTGSWFRWQAASDDEIADLFREPLFFQAAVADGSRETSDRLVAARLEAIYREQATAEAKDAKAKAAAVIDVPSADWLLWEPDERPVESEPSAEDLAERTRPAVLASYDNGHPFLVERRIGQGRLVLLTTAIGSDWNTLTTTNAVLVLDRLCRSLMLDTLPARNFATGQAVTVLVDPQERRNQFTLARPRHPLEPVGVDALGGDAYGVVVRDLTSRGLYRIGSYRPGAPMDGPESKLSETPLAVNGPERESDLRTLDAAALAQRLSGVGHRLVAAAEPIRVEGAQIHGQDFWKWLMTTALACVALETVVLAHSERRRTA